MNLGDPVGVEESDRIGADVVDAYLEVQMRTSGVALRAHPGDELTSLDVCRGADEQLVSAHVTVNGLDAARMLQDDPIAKALCRAQ